MNLKTYQADSMQEALAKVRDELGPEAVIVKTRQVQRKGARKPGFEVTAAVETAAPAAAAPAKKAPATAASAGLKPLPKQYDWTGRLPRVSSQEPARPAPAENVEDLRAELRKVKEQAEMPTRELRLLREEIQAMLESATASVPGEGLLAADFPPALAESLRRRAGSYSSPESLGGFMASDFRYAGGIRLKSGRTTRVLLIGPSGAGKTALIEKLAAQGRLRAGKKVGVISADRRRLGAHAGLSLFAKTLGLPLACVFDAGEATAALKAMHACDLVLIDAPSYPAGEAGWRDLESLSRAVAPDETHLVVNACTRERELRKTIHDFSRLRPNRLSLTRLDECLGVGGLYAAALAFPAPLAYLSSGSATDDIEVASPASLARRFAYGLKACANAVPA